MINNSKLNTQNSTLKTFLFTLLFTIMIVAPAFGVDAELTRQTIKGLEGVSVIVEDIQPNIQKYAQKAGITKEQIQKDVEAKLKSNGIKVLTKDEWLKTPGRPVLYVNINTHETEKYWYAYNVRLELKQVVSLEANPSIKTLASTWSIDITGVANIGTLGVIKNAVDGLVSRFISALKS
ncbi:MAG: hypothetical protein NTX36_11315 [Proteobacteria bacterium]|nr:hypothetical protein [Pseudomonadota bacterium]